MTLKIKGQGRRLSKYSANVLLKEFDYNARVELNPIAGLLLLRHPSDVDWYIEADDIALDSDSRGSFKSSTTSKRKNRHKTIVAR